MSFTLIHISGCAIGSHSNFMHVSDMRIAWLQVCYVKIGKNALMYLASIIIDGHELYSYGCRSATQVT